MKTCQTSITSYCSVDVSKPVCLSLIYPRSISKSKYDLRFFKSQLQEQLQYSNIFECGSAEPDTIEIIGTDRRRAADPHSDRFNLLIFSQVPEMLARALNWQSNWQVLWEYLLRGRESNNYGHTRLAS